MSSVTDPDASRHRRRLTARVKGSLRELRNQLSLLNHQIGGRLALKDVDLDCLDLIAMHGPLSPSALARRSGQHPATITGILDRLQRGGWIARERDPSATDRRAVTIRALNERNREMFRLYSGMSTAMDQVCADYTEAELAVIADFLRRATEAGHAATAGLTRD